MMSSTEAPWEEKSWAFTIMQGCMFTLWHTSLWGRIIHVCKEQEWRLSFYTRRRRGKGIIVCITYRKRSIIHSIQSQGAGVATILTPGGGGGGGGVVSAEPSLLSQLRARPVEACVPPNPCPVAIQSKIFVSFTRGLALTTWLVSDFVIQGETNFPAEMTQCCPWRRIRAGIEDGVPEPLRRVLRGGGGLLLPGGVRRLQGARLSVLHTPGSGFAHFILASQNMAEDPRMESF